MSTWGLILKYVRGNLLSLQQRRRHLHESSACGEGHSLQHLKQLLVFVLSAAG